MTSFQGALPGNPTQMSPTGAADPVELSRGLVAAGETDVADLAAAELQGRLCFIPIGGCGAASLWENRLAEFARPEHHVLDSDRLAAGDALSSEKQNYVTKFAGVSDGRVAVRILDRREMENYLTPEAVVAQMQPLYGDGFESAFRQRVSSEDWAYLDLPEACAEVAHDLDREDSVLPWLELDEKSRASKESKMKKRLAKAFSHETVAAELIASVPDLLLELRAVSTRLAAR